MTTLPPPFFSVNKEGEEKRDIFEGMGERGEKKLRNNQNMRRCLQQKKKSSIDSDLVSIARIDSVPTCCGGNPNRLLTDKFYLPYRRPPTIQQEQLVDRV